MKHLAILSHPEPDPFPFTEEELFLAFRLVTDEDEARLQARQMIAAVAEEPLWDASDESLALLALGSHSAAAKVELVRQQRGPDRDAWMKLEMHQAGLEIDSPAPAWLVEKWDVEAAARDRAWDEIVSGLRARLIAQGKLSPDSR